MKSIIKISKYSLLHCCLFIILAAIAITSYAQDIVDTSSPHDPIVAPTIVVGPSTIKPDCHSYTGCGAIVVKRYHIYHHKPKQHCPKLYCPQQHCVYHRPC